MRLIDLQRSFQAAILGTGGGELGLDTTARPWVHQHHFWSRMRDFAVTRHPKLARWLGDAEMQRIVRAYITAHPPRDLLGSGVMARLADFLAVATPWCAFPIIAHFALFDFQRSAIDLAAEQATLTERDLPVRADTVLRLKKRAALIITRFKFHLVRPSQIGRETALDDIPTYLLVHKTDRRSMTIELDQPAFLALERLIEGARLRDLVAYMRSPTFGAAEIEQFVARCASEDLLVAEGV